MIESARILDPQFNDAVVYLTGAQIELLRNVSGYLRRLETYTAEYHLGWYLTPTAGDYDQLMAIVADLEEKLMGNENTIWGYKDQHCESYAGTKSGDGTYQQWGSAVPAGEVWVLQQVLLVNTTGARGRIDLMVDTSEGLLYLDSVGAPGTDAVVWTGALVMEEGNSLEITQLLCLNGDVMRGGMIAATMDVPT